jgi:uncharacterized protein (TIGR03792 family)
VEVVRTGERRMVIEQLTFTVPLQDRARYLALDAEIWTPALAAQPGFLGKEAWVEAEAPERLHLVIRWDSRAAWHAVPRALLEATEARFRAALGAVVPVERCLDQDVVSPRS